LNRPTKWKRVLRIYGRALRAVDITRRGHGCRASLPVAWAQPRSMAGPPEPLRRPRPRGRRPASPPRRPPLVLDVFHPTPRSENAYRSGLIVLWLLPVPV